MRRRILIATVFIVSTCISCASTQKQDIDGKLIAAMAANCKTVEMKADRETYTISPTGKISENGCPVALIRGWREGRIIREREVEICKCREIQE